MSIRVNVDTVKKRYGQGRTTRRVRSPTSHTNDGPQVGTQLQRTCRGKENHIDHGTGEQSFKAILKNFQTDCLLRPVTAKDGDTPSIRSKWEKYHKQMARLSLTCKACNLANK
jgi:hypothetical protein